MMCHVIRPTPPPSSMRAFTISFYGFKTFDHHPNNVSHLAQLVHDFPIIN